MQCVNNAEAVKRAKNRLRRIDIRKVTIETGQKKETITLNREEKLAIFQMDFLGNIKQIIIIFIHFKFQRKNDHSKWLDLRIRSVFWFFFFKTMKIYDLLHPMPRIELKKSLENDVRKMILNGLFRKQILIFLIKIDVGKKLSHLWIRIEINLQQFWKIESRRLNKYVRCSNYIIFPEAFINFCAQQISDNLFISLKVLVK